MMKNQKGITLIALIITIIVMLILVAVTISMAVNGGLFGYAGNAASETKTALEDEKNLGDGSVEATIDGYSFSSMEDIEQYIKNGTVPVTAEDILRFIDEDDVCWNSSVREFTEKLKYMGDGYEYFENSGSCNVYRCSLNNKIYVVGTIEGHENAEVEQLDWDATVTLDNEGNPAIFSTSFGDYQRGYDSNEGEFSLITDSGTGRKYIYLIPPYPEFGWLRRPIVLL